MEILHPDPRDDRNRIPVYAKERGKTVFVFQPPDSIIAVQASEKVIVPLFHSDDHDTLSVTISLLDAASADSEVRAPSFAHAMAMGEKVLLDRGLKPGVVLVKPGAYPELGYPLPPTGGEVIIVHEDVPDGMAFILPESKEVGFSPTAKWGMVGLVVMKPENVIRVRWADPVEKKKTLRWTVVGIYVGGDHDGKPFTCYLSGVSAEEAKEAAEKTNADRGDAVRVLACVPGGKPATVFGVTSRESPGR